MAAYEEGGSGQSESERQLATPQATGQVVSLRASVPEAYRASSPKPANGDAFERPTWQDYFFLAPNVRFTRTPDSDMTKRHPSQDDDDNNVKRAAAAAGATGPVAAEKSTSPVSAPTATLKAVPVQPVASTAAAPATPPLSPNRPQANRQVTAAATRPSPAAIATPAVAPPADKPRPLGARWSYLSDHAFFEFAVPIMAERLSRARRDEPGRSTAVVPASAPPVTARPAELEFPGAITSLYRTIEWHFNASIVPAPTEAPVAAEASDTKAAAQVAPRRVAAGPAKPADVVSAPPKARAGGARHASRALPPPLAETGAATAGDAYELPSEDLLQHPPEGQGFYMSQERLEQNADLLESVLEDFGVRGEIIHVRPGPVVTLYEFEPAPGVKSSRVIGLADDIARSMSAVSARVAVVPGRNVIGIELPNETRETVYFRELIGSDGFQNTGASLALCLGKTIGGEPVIAELAKMPHLLVAGTTGSGKSVAINTMILSLLYRLKPEECRLIMVDPKMLELSIYDGIPHLLTPVVTDPKKAVTALKWAVREMEDRYRKMARLGVRNIDGYNQRAAAARDKGEIVVMQVQTGFEKGTGEPLFEEQAIDLAPMPYIVIIVDEMADLMMVAGKEIEGAIQR
ncbi:DNA translocase FtsK, partial [Mesorhizobium sp.]|uniref:DNA translocase FtsK n=1 Tax=Mesorhizobium sp. TaxID=1871066 RepID=UPI0025F39C82